MTPKILLIGLHRSGSNVASRLILNSDNFKKYENDHNIKAVILGEAFTVKTNLFLKKDGSIDTNIFYEFINSVTDTERGYVEYNSTDKQSLIMDENYACALLNDLKKISPIQPIILKLLVSNMSVDLMMRIIMELSNSQFTVIFMHRENIKAQMASYVLANIHGVWDRYSKKNETYLVSDPIKNVVLERMVVKQYLKQFVEFHNKFQMIIDTIKESDLRFNIIRYEHLNDDLEKIGFNITELKSSEIISYKDDHYERVTDKLLFQNMIEQFYEKL